MKTLTSMSKREPTDFGKDSVLLVFKKKRKEYSKEATEINEAGHHEVADKILEVVDAMDSAISILKNSHRWAPSPVDYYNL